MKPSFTPTEKRRLLFIPLTQSLVWVNQGDGDLVNHKTYTDFCLYLLQVGVMGEGSSTKVNATPEVLQFLWRSFLAGQTLEAVHNIIQHHTIKNHKEYPGLLQNVTPGPKAPQRDPLVARGFFNKIKASWQKIVRQRK